MHSFVARLLLSRQPWLNATSLPAKATRSLAWEHMSGGSSPDGLPRITNVIGDNTTEAGGAQNIIIIQQFIKVYKSGEKLDTDEEVLLTQLRPSFLQFLKSLIPRLSAAPPKPRDMRPNEEPPKEAPPSDMSPPMTGPPSPASLFSMLRDFRNEFTLASTRHQRSRGNGLLECFGREFRTNIQRWLEPSRSEIFPARSDDPRLTLEMTYGIGRLIEQLQAPGVAQVVHLCHENHRRKSAQKGSQLRILCIDLIWQILQHHAKFNGPPNAEDLAAVKSDDLDSLWDAFRRCVKRAEIKTLFIFLDRVDVLHDACQISGDAAQFDCFVKHIATLLCRPDIVVKVMVTSRDAKVAERFKGPRFGFRSPDANPNARQDAGAEST